MHAYLSSSHKSSNTYDHAFQLMMIHVCVGEGLPFPGSGVLFLLRGAVSLEQHAYKRMTAQDKRRLHRLSKFWFFKLLSFFSPALGLNAYTQIYIDRLVPSSDIPIMLLSTNHLNTRHKHNMGSYSERTSCSCT